MKECKYCRTQYDDELPVCPNCGASKVISEDELSEEAEMIQREAEYRKKASDMYRKKKHWHIARMVGILLIIGIGICLLLFEKSAPLSNGMTQDESKESLATGIAYLDNGEYESAMECFLQLPSDSKQYLEAQSLLLQARDYYRSEILDRANLHITNKEYDTAFNLISKAQEFLPDDSELQSAYDNVYSKYRSSVLEQVDSYISNGQYDLALEYLNGVQAKFPNDAVLQDSYNDTLSAYQVVIRTEAIEQADAYVSENNYASAIETVNAALDKIGQDDELSAKLNVFTDTYSAAVIKAAKDKYVEYNYDSIISAEEMLKGALAVMPNNSALTSELAFYEEKAPTDIMSLPSYDTDYIFTRIGDVVDNQGVAHENAINLSTFTWINTDYQYTKLTGIFFQNSKYSNSPIYHTLKIYGEHQYDYWGGDNLIWEGQVNGDSAPIYLDLDISHYGWLEFVLSDWDYDEQTYISDMFAWK
ncbi:hypothetical protein AALA61_09650 [Oscillospiraceae bacterium 42-9]